MRRLVTSEGDMLILPAPSPGQRAERGGRREVGEGGSHRRLGRSGLCGLGGAWEKAGPAWDWQLWTCQQMVS